MTVYAAPSGSSLSAGRWQERAAIIGDSLTAESYGLTTFHWLNGVNGGLHRLVANCGTGSEGVGNVLSRVNNSYLDGNPGLAGLSPLGRVFVRIGTNNARNAQSIGALSSTYASLLQAIAGYCQQVVILSVPPLGASAAAYNAFTISYNAWLAAYAEAHGNQFLFLDDCAPLHDGAGDQIAAYFNADGVHFNGFGCYLAGVTGGDLLASRLGSADYRLSTDRLDVYPAHPQWTLNPTNVGSGSVVNNLSIGAYGAGVASTNSIIAPDAIDPNRTPWQRVQVTQGTAGSRLRLGMSLNGRAIGAADPAVLDAMMEIRFVNFDATNVLQVQSFLQGGSGEYLVRQHQLMLGGSGIHRSAVLRHAIPRASGVAQSSATLLLDMYFSNSFGPGANIGSMDVRNWTVRG